MHTQQKSPNCWPDIRENLQIPRLKIKLRTKYWSCITNKNSHNFDKCLLVILDILFAPNADGA